MCFNISSETGIFSNYVVSSDIILAPEVPNLQSSTRGAVSRSNSREQEKTDVQVPRSEVGYLIDNIHTPHQIRPKSFNITEANQAVPTIRQRNVGIEREGRTTEPRDDTLYTRNYRRLDDLQGSFRDFQGPSDEYLLGHKNETESRLFYAYEEEIPTTHINTVCTDYMSLSLSPSTNRSEDSFIHSYGPDNRSL